MAYYTASLYVGQMTEGDQYTLLRPAISICVLDAIMFRRSPEIHSEFRLRSRDGTLDLTDDLQIHFLELPKYTVPDDNRVIVDPVEAWPDQTSTRTAWSQARIAYGFNDGPAIGA